MIAFIVNYKRAEQGDFLAPQGDYETIISQAKFDCTVSGKDYIRLTLRIREDIAQEGAGELLEYPIWKRCEPTVRDPEGYPHYTLQVLARCAGLQNGLKFAVLSDLLDALYRRPIKVCVKHEKYNGVIREKVSYIMPSDQPQTEVSAYQHAELHYL